MKNFLTFFISLCIAVSLTACNISDNSPQKETSAENSVTKDSQKPTDETFGLNDSAVFDNLKVTAVKLEESTGKDIFKAESGKVFIGINFEIENISEETQNVSSVLLFDAYADDIKCDYSVSANAAFGDGTLDGELSPGKKLVGWYAVEVPQDWHKIDLEVKAKWLSDNKAKFVFEK